MLAVAAATLATLLGGAVALPAATTDHRALFTTHAKSPAAKNNNHLYFYSQECEGIPVSQGGRGYTNCNKCGEVDAAPYMPAALFEPRNALALAAYVEVTIRLYVNPNPRGTPLKLGRCASVGYSIDCETTSKSPCDQYGDRVQASWWGARTAGGAQASALMAETCGTKCKCNFRGSLSNNRLPACKDEPDDPAAGTWCSLCGPTTACPGCASGYKVTIATFIKPEGHTSPPTAPQPNTPNTNHLWFRLVRPIQRVFARPGDPVHCGEVDAGPRTPASLFEPSNKAELDRYIKVTIKAATGAYAYDTANNGGVELGRCRDLGYNVPGGNRQIDWTAGFVSGNGGQVMTNLCKARCNCVFGRPGFANNCARKNGNVNDDPSKGFFCSLCQTSGLTNSVATIDFYTKSSAQNIVAIAVATPDLSTLVAAVKAAGLVDTLSGAGPFTVFAPTNAAFAAIQSVVDQLLLPEYKPQLIKLLTYHVLASKVVASAITNGESVATVEGQQVCFEVNHRTGAVGVFPCGSTARASRVTTADVLASNGVVHIIDEVLVPAGFLPLSPAGKQTYVCLNNQCVVSASGVSKDDCSQICGGQ